MASDVVKLYFADLESFDAQKDLSKICPPERTAEISAVRNLKVRKEKLCVWDLLDTALCDHFGYGTEKAELFRNENGKWCSAKENVFFSLSHSASLCAVAVGSIACGVDAELMSKVRFDEKLAKKILTEGEHMEYARLNGDKRPLYTAQKWTEKESIFKMCGGDAFVPSSIEVSNYCTESTYRYFDNDGYFVSVSGERAFELVVADTDKKIKGM